MALERVLVVRNYLYIVNQQSYKVYVITVQPFHFPFPAKRSIHFLSDCQSV